MAASVTTSVGIGSVTPATTVETASFTPTGSNKVLYFLVGSGAGTPGNPTSVKYASTAGTGGEALTLLDSVRIVNTNVKTSVWKLVSPSASSGTAWAQYASTDDERWIIAVAVQDAAGTEGTIAYATATASAAATVNATSTSGELILGLVSVLNTSAATPTLTAGQTTIKELEGATAGANGIGVNEAAGVERQTAAGASTTMSWTISSGSSDWGLHAFQVNPAAAGAGSPPLPKTQAARYAPLLRF